LEIGKLKLIENITIREIIMNNRINLNTSQKIYECCVITNQFVNPLNELLDYNLRGRGVNVKTKILDLNNLHARKDELNDISLIIVNYVPLADMHISSDFFYDSENLLATIINRSKIDITRIMKILPDFKPVIFLLFSAKNLTGKFESVTLIDKVMLKLNNWVIDTYPSVNFVEPVEVVAAESLPYFPRINSQLNKYPLMYLKKLCSKISNLVITLVSAQKKVLILDCDGTLWKGLIGEQELSELEHFNEIHNIIKILSDAGALICLVTKNERVNIDKFLASSDIFSESDFIKIFANWDFKSKNIKRISDELKLNIDSFVFVDDSISEIEEVGNAFPNITTLLVNSNYDVYIRDMTALIPQFIRGQITYEDRHRAKNYLVEKIRSKDRVIYNGEYEYLESLKMELVVKYDELEDSERISQLSVKTNQFNLTQVRYSPEEIRKIIENESFVVISFRLKDKYSDLGLVGLAILELHDNFVNIININLSCRAFSRRLENIIMEEIVRYSIMRDYTTLKGKFRKSEKNMYAGDYYSDNNFIMVSADNDMANYELILIEYIKSTNENLFNRNELNDK
jgi:FkbH-like protein